MIKYISDSYRANAPSVCSVFSTNASAMSVFSQTISSSLMGPEIKDRTLAKFLAKKARLVWGVSLYLENFYYTLKKATAIAPGPAWVPIVLPILTFGR